MPCLTALSALVRAGWVLLTIFALLIGTSVYGQNLAAGHVAIGQVVDQRGTGVPNVMVRPVNRKTGFREKSVTTDPRGYFQMTGLQNGIWCLQIRKDGYEAEIEVDCREDHKVQSTLYQAKLEVHGDGKDVPEPNPIPLKRVPRVSQATLGSSPDSMSLSIVFLTGVAPVIVGDANLPQPDVQPLGGSSSPEVQVQGWTVTGSVSDRDGRSLRGAEVYILSDESDDIFSGRTDDKGAYKIPISGPGRYYLVVVAENYEKRRVPFVLRPTETQKRLANIVLVAAPNEGIQTEPRVIAAIESSRRTYFSERELNALPLPGIRTFDSLALLVPGVFPPPTTSGQEGPGISAGVGASGQFSVNGLRSRTNNFTVDGSDNNEEDVGVRRQGFVSLVPQPIESVQEFQIITALADARFGRNLGAQVNAVSQYGGKELHGTLYGFLTDRSLNARDFFDLDAKGGPPVFPLTRPADGTPILLDGQPIIRANPAGGKDPFTRTQTGFVLGGPLRSAGPFFYASLERQEIHNSRESHFAVPTVAERGVFDRGDLGLTLGGRVLAPASLPGNAILSLFPFPNNPLGPYGPNTFTEILPADGEGTILSGKVDHSFRWIRTWTHAFSGRYNLTDDQKALPVTGGALFSSLRPETRTQNLSLLLISTPSSRTSNALRLSYGRSRFNFFPVSDPFLTPSRLSDVGPDGASLLNAPLLLNVTAQGSRSSFVSSSSPQGRAILEAAGLSGLAETEQVTGPIGQVLVAGFSPLGVDVFNFPQHRVNNTFQVADTFTHIRGRHIWTAGVDVRRTQINSFVNRNFRPQVVFNGVLNQSPLSEIPLNVQQVLSGATLAAVGSPSGFFQTLANTSDPDTSTGVRLTQYNLFVQHELRTSHFTFSHGIRYELNKQPSIVGDRLERALGEARTFFNALERDSGLSFQSYVQLLTPPFFVVNHSFAPRVGVAWDPGGNGKTVIRGGYGIYFDQFLGTVTDQFHTLPPAFFGLNSIVSARVDLVFPQQTLVTPGTLNRLSLPPELFLSQAANEGQLLLPFTVPRGLRVPYSQQYGLTIEREVPGGFQLSAAYVGTRGIRLLRLTTPDLGLNRIIQLANASSSGPAVSSFDILALSPLKTVLLGELLVPHQQIESSASSTYHSLQLEARRRYRQGVQVAAAFTYSRVLDDVSDLFDVRGAFVLPQDSSSLRAERGPANFDSRLRFVSNLIWDLPFYAQHRLLGGWQAAGILSFQTGQPFTVNSAIDINEDGNLTDRLNTTEGLTTEDHGRRRIQVASGRSPLELLASAGENGSIGRNTFRAAGIATLDAAFTKAFQFHDRHHILLRAEIFNLFNRTHFGTPVRILEAPSFGSSVNTTIPARRIQFSVKYRF